MLTGKRIVFTGELRTMKRADASAMAYLAGASVKSCISKAVDVLVVGRKPGSKLEKARAYGIPTITENEFLAMFAS